MRPLSAAAVLAAMVAATAAALLGPWPVALALAAGGGALARAGRGMLLGFALVALPLNALVGWVALGSPWDGLAGGLRLVAALAANVALLSRVGLPRLLDGLRLPRALAAPVAAVLLAAHEAGRDFARLRDARRLDGDWPRGRLAAAREAATLLPALFVAAERRAHERRDALRLAGRDAPGWFVPVVAVAALVAAGRLAFLAFPNVALSYAVAFLGGLAYGPLAAAAGAALGMAVTDLMLTGLYPLGFVNVPAMALLALAGAALRRVDWDGATRADRAAGRVFAFAAGAAGTLLFSVASDTATWLVVAPGSLAAWRVLVVAGLAFNLVPAVVNGVLFAASVSPVARAFRALREGGPRAPAPTGAGTPAAPPAP